MPTPSAEPARLTTPAALRRWSLRCHAAGMTVGLVPTMGALHRGHLSLIERARHECDRVVVSIFVNPAQFSPHEDLARYPRQPDRDLQMLKDARVDAVFIPEHEEMYPPGSATTVRVTGPAGTTLEAVARPGHFEGVALIVTKLLVAARPDRAYFGRKDAQQCAVVERLARDLDTGVQIVVCPVVRDADGLALSSRNVFLGSEERQRALALPRGLAAAAQLFSDGEHTAAALVARVRRELDAAGVVADYVAIVDPETFDEVETAVAGCEILAAVRMTSARLIDVMCLGMDEAPGVDGASG